MAIGVSSASANRTSERLAESNDWRAHVGVRRASAWWVLVAGGTGLVASLMLTIEKVNMLTDPSYRPSCNINPVLACGSVMATTQEHAFGFPNPIIGIVAFTVAVVTGVLAVADVRLPRWYWMGLAGGTLLGVGFIHWLIFQSLYRIGALCPYCMVVWAITTPLLVVSAAIALRPLGRYPAIRMLYEWRWSIAALWFTTVILLILVRFWSYWSTVI